MEKKEKGETEKEEKQKQERQLIPKHSESLSGAYARVCARGVAYIFSVGGGGGTLAVLWAHETTLEILDLTNSGGRAESPTMIKMAKA